MKAINNMNKTIYFTGNNKTLPITFTNKKFVYATICCTDEWITFNSSRKQALIDANILTEYGDIYVLKYDIKKDCVNLLYKKTKE